MKKQEKQMFEVIKLTGKFFNTLQKLNLITKGQNNQVHNILTKALNKLEKSYGK